MDGFFTNHSLRRSGTKRLFQAAVERQLIKQFTGHVSAVVDKYQVTSNDQREAMSTKSSNSVSVPPNEVNSCLEVTVKENYEGTLGHATCSCNSKTVKMHETKDIGEMINSLVRAKKGAKATIKIEIEFS